MGRRLLYAAATMTGTAVGLGASALGLLRHQAGALRHAFDDDVLRVHSTFAEAADPVSPTDEDTGSETTALAVLGDSWLCGVDLDSPDDAPANLIARGLARILGTTVRVQSSARPSALSEDLPRQVDEILRSAWLSRQLSEGWAQERRFAILSIGTGDIIHPIHGTIGIPILNQAINRLQREGRYSVYVLVCPNLGGLPGLRDPLKTSLRRTSRVLAGSQWLAALAARAVPLSVTGALSGTTRASLLAESGRFPSRLGYAQLSSTVLAAIAARTGATVSVDRSHDIDDSEIGDIDDSGLDDSDITAADAADSLPAVRSAAAEEPT